VEAGYWLIKRIGRQMTEPSREPIFPPIAPIAVLGEPAVGDVEAGELVERMAALATTGPLGECGTSVMAWLSVVLQ
jgi:hypothetical protein